jgi:hypothetical protein
MLAMGIVELETILRMDLLVGHQRVIMLVRQE